jgi:hypothetical protein
MIILCLFFVVFADVPDEQQICEIRCNLVRYSESVLTDVAAESSDGAPCECSENSTVDTC